MPRVSVIIPHYRNLDGLKVCLDALKAQTYPAQDVEIIVAENNSGIPLSELEFVASAGARLVVVEEPGAGPARNGGVALATGDVLAFTDADCVPDRNWLNAGINALAGYDLVGGAMNVLVSDQTNMTGAEAFERVFAFDAERYVKKKRFAVTANLFCSRTVFDRVGGFRVGVSEDLEWCHRARDLGFRLGYASDAIVAHPARRNWEELRSKWRRLNMETYHLHRERGKGDLSWLLRNLAVPVSAFVHIPKVLFSNQLISFSQRMRATKILIQLRLWRFVDGLRLVMSHRDA